MDISDAVGKLVVGVVSSVGTFSLVKLANFIKYYRLYHYLNGRYVLVTPEGDRHATDSVTVKHTGGRSVAISCDTPTERWESRIMMSEDIRDFGQGIYQHGGKFDCGIHQIQLNRRDNCIYVVGYNTSHVDGTKFAYILRRHDPQLR